MAGRGGGPGRTPGAANTHSRMVANRLMNDGEPTPLEIMVGNARFYHALALKEEREWKAQTKKAATARVFRRVAMFKSFALEAAVAAAPYMHSKLQATTLEGANGGPLTFIFPKEDRDL